MFQTFFSTCFCNNTEKVVLGFFTLLLQSSTRDTHSFNLLSKRTESIR